MARCSHSECGRWRPDFAVRVFGLGLQVDDDWFCSNPCVEAVAVERLRAARERSSMPRRPLRRLGTIMLQERTLTLAQLTTALEVQRETRLPLGVQLQRLGFATRDAVLKALASQNGVGYLATVDLAAVRSAPGGLSPDEVDALGVVPFRAQDNRLLVACPAPLPCAALDALESLTGFEIEPFLVIDEDFERLRKAYGGARDTAAETTKVRDIAEGAARIASAAAASKAVTLREASVNAFTWVRIASQGRTSTLLVPPGPRSSQEHEPWLAATTPH
jgi:hypothetical protein